MLQAMHQELSLQHGYLSQEKVTSIYFGGGTPSILTTQDIEALLAHIKQVFGVTQEAEITLEANPDDMCLDKLVELRALGINRLSIGIQSFQDHLLRFLNRVHDRKKALASMELAAKAKFDNLSIDLIYGIPGQTDAMWEHDLNLAMRLYPPHIAAYCLTIEPNTVFGRWQQQGKLQPIQEETAARQFELLVDKLVTNHHYEHYEVSNFCLPGQYAQHNSNYWKQISYLGIGPGAHSYNGTTRQYNIAHNQRYIHSIQQSIIPSTLEVLTRKDHINEYIMTGLRTKWGCDLAWLERHHQYALQQDKSVYLAQLLQQGLALLQGNTLRLTTQGMLLADKIALDLFVA